MNRGTGFIRLALAGNLSTRASSPPRGVPPPATAAGARHPLAGVTCASWPGRARC